jgi:hypothetical protein
LDEKPTPRIVWKISAEAQVMLASDSPWLFPSDTGAHVAMTRSRTGYSFWHVRWRYLEIP